MKKIIFRKFSFLILSFCVFLLFSCKGIEVTGTVYVSAPEFSREMSMMLIVEEKNKYEEMFGQDIWKIKSGKGDVFFKDYVVSNVKKFVEKLMALNLLASERGVYLSNKDKELVNEAANEYMNSLTNEDIEYIGCDIEDVVNMYSNYKIANTVIDDMTKNSNVELSISEAKVIKVNYMTLPTEEKAKEIRELLNVRGASFEYYANSYGEESGIDLIIKRGDNLSSIFPEVFYLATGQVSDVLYYQNKYYLFKCTSDYLEKETNDRKKEILVDLKNKEFDEQFDTFTEQHDVKSNATYWNEIDLSEGVNCKVRIFYTIYDKYFSE